MYISFSRIVCYFSLFVGVVCAVRSIASIGTDLFVLWTIAAFVAYINAGVWYIAGNIRRDQ